jgi:transposase
MDKDALQLLLAQGVSVEQIGRRFGKHPSTVSYWMRKHGLEAPNRAKHAAKGGIGRERLTELVGRGMTISEIATEVGLSKGAVRHWLGRYGLRTRHRGGRRSGPDSRDARYAGRCCLCGYDRYAGALHIHHVDPAVKRMNVSAAGIAHRIEALREEAGECVLLCSNCHAEVEADVVVLPLHLAERVRTRDAQRAVGSVHHDPG